MTPLTESVLALHLARGIDDLEEGRYVANDTIGYLRTGSGKEVDFGPVCLNDGSMRSGRTPVEAKWVDDRWRADEKVIEAKFGNGILATKSILDTNHPTWAVPAPLVALLLL
jgi:uncharacterized protein